MPGFEDHPTPTYLRRLRVEGGCLLVCGALGSAGLVLFTSAARREQVSSAVQLAVVALLLAVLGPRGLRRSVAASEPRAPEGVGSGEPTPLWHIAAIVAVLGGLVAWLDPSAGLRVTVGCALVGGAQALLLAGLVRREQARSGRVFYRGAGSRILRGTRLVSVTRRG